MKAVISALVAMFATSAGHGQTAWILDTNFRSPFEWGGVADIEFRPEGLLVSGEWKYLNDAMNWPRRNTYLSETGEYDIGAQVGGGGGMMGPWGDRFYVRNGQGVIRKFYWPLQTDYSFNMNSLFASTTHGGDFHVYPDGKVLMTGSHDLWNVTDTSFMGSQFCLVRWDTTGLPDPTFQHRQCANGIIQKILQLPDGKFLCSGGQGIYDGHPVGHILRLHPDGELDTAFHTLIDYGIALDYYFYPDGRILCSGYFHTPEMPDDTLQLIRLLPDGSLDLSFNYDLDFLKFPTWTYVTATANGLFALDSATLLVGGAFTNLNDQWVGGIFAMDTAGNVLEEYFPGMGCDTVVWMNPTIYELGLRDFEMSPEGDLYAYGFFHGFDDGYINDPEQRLIVRLKRVNVGVAEPASALPELALFPNPGSDRFTIQCGRPLRSLRMQDALGRQVWSVSDIAQPIHVDTSRWPIGCYTLHVQHLNGAAQHLKWIKQ